jgi:RNA polymerase sigma-70 factor (ECF subfamily)
MKTNASSPEISFNELHNDLIDGCKKYDQRSQFQVYKLYYKAMYNISLRIVKDEMEAEDIMQESFLTAFEKIGTWSAKVSFGAWLKKIVQNKSIDALRKKNKVNFEDLPDNQDFEDLSSENDYYHEQNLSRIEKLKESVEFLSEGCRNIFSLYFFEGYDYEEISKILSITESTSRSQLSRAKNQVYKLMGMTSHSSPY